ncbi:MAG: class Ib ribonucleoside-diphosphate reductase assembly flavoprotein NrdI [Culicoidibacterales bacterium]
MLITYISKTGNIKRFVGKLSVENTQQILTGTELIAEKSIFITYTTGIGEIPKEADLFVKNNAAFIFGIVGSGNRNWGSAYCIAADKLSNRYGIPVLMKFEMSGRSADVKQLMERIDEFEILRTK